MNTRVKAILQKLRLLDALNWVQHLLGRSALIVNFAVLLRNQCNMVINYRFAQSWRFNDTGEQWLIDAVAPRSQTFFDVGANIGDWTAKVMTYGTQGRRFVVLEPGSLAYERLRERFAGLDAVHVRNSAVSSTCGEATLYEQPNSELSSLAHQVTQVANRPTRVTVTTLDDLAAQLACARIDFLKIDVEGYDLHVIVGAKGLLAEQRVGVLQFEYNDPWRYAGSTLSAAYQTLEQAGYTVMMLRRDGLYEFDYAKYGDFFGYSNFVAVAPSMLPVLQPYFKGRI